MSERKLRCEIITPERQVFAGDVDMVIAPGIQGEIGILPLHAPFVTILKIGELRLKIGDKYEYVALGGGYLEVSEDKVVVLADTAEFAAEIDIERAKQSKKRAEEQLTRAKKEREIGFTKFEVDLERAVNRIKVAGRVGR